MSDLAVLAPSQAAGRRKKDDTRERLLSAARAKFCAHGYVGVSVEDIAAAAGVTRMTFYRHVPGKAALAIELYRAAEQSALPRLLAIRDRDYTDAGAVQGWIAELFEADRGDRLLLRAFNQAAAVEPAFTERAQGMIAEMIFGLGVSIPAFAVRPEATSQRRRWLQAWLLIYEILDQGNHAALESGVACDPEIVPVLAERFLDFVRGVP